MSVLPHSSAGSGHGESPRDALTIIRSATAACHAAMERVIDWPLAFSSPERYRDLLRRYQRVVEPLEVKLAPFAMSLGNEQSSDPLSNTSARCCRVSQLRNDIDALQHYSEEHEWAEMEAYAIDTAFIVDSSAALGVTYVLEGSALGGQILSKQLRAGVSRWASTSSSLRAGERAEHPIDSYFVGRGAETGAYWRAFCARLNRELPDAQSASVAAQAAVTTFECFRCSFAGKLA